MTEAAKITVPDIATLPPAERAVIVLDSTKAEEQLRAMLADTADIQTVADKDDRAMVHNAAMKLKTARVAIEKTGKAARDDANAFSKAVIAEEKRLTAIITDEEDRLFKLRDEYDQKIEEEKRERERKEQERVAGIKSRIAAIKLLPLDSANDSSAHLHQTIHDLTDFEIGDDFAEFKDEAATAKWEAIAALQKLWEAAGEREAAAARLQEERARLEAERAQEEARLKAEREALEAKRAEEEERQRVERDKLAAERAELEALRAQLAAQQAAAAPAPEPVVEEVQAEPVAADEELAPADQPELFGMDMASLPDDVVVVDMVATEGDPMDATAFVREMAKVTAMQFQAMSEKAAAFGFEEYAAQLAHIANSLHFGEFDSNLMAADWTAIGNADKAMALASHAGVALVFGDQEMGAATLLQAAE